MNRPQTVLAFDTGSQVLSVALFAGEDEFDHSEAQSRSSARLPTVAADLLDRASRSWTDLDAVIAARGPGSFTGLRVGLAFALGLHQALGIRATAISTLELLARSSEVDGRVTAAVNAWRSSWFAQTYSAEPRVADGEPEQLSLEDLATRGHPLVTSTPFPELSQAEVPGRSIAHTAARLATRSDLDWEPSALTRPLYLAAAPAMKPKAHPRPESARP